MGEVCVHDYHKIPSTKLQAVDVGGSQTELSCPRLQYNPIAPIYSSELLGYFLRSIRTGVIDNDDLPIEIALFERFCQEPDDDGKVLCVRCRLEV